MTYCDAYALPLQQLLARYNMSIVWVEAEAQIPGTFWGEPEAGLIESKLYVRKDTPLHSAMHETCHYICMDDQRRQQLHTNAGGDVAEENAVCYLQILLADHLAGYDRCKMMQDMDAWGYSFRLGSSQRWFHEDAADVTAWLMATKIIDLEQKPTWQLRQPLENIPTT